MKTLAYSALTLVIALASTANASTIVPTRTAKVRVQIIKNEFKKYPSGYTHQSSIVCDKSQTIPVLDFRGRHDSGYSTTETVCETEIKCQKTKVFVESVLSLETATVLGAKSDIKKLRSYLSLDRALNEQSTVTIISRDLSTKSMIGFLDRHPSTLQTGDVHFSATVEVED